MNSLPEELLALIIEHCDHASLKSIRLVTRQLNTISSPKTFEHFFTGVFEYGLQKLHNLSISHLSKHVKKFTIYSDIVPEWNRIEWQKQIDFRPDFSSWYASRKAELGPMYRSSNPSYNPHAEYAALQLHNFCNQELDEAWSNYERIRDEQQAWRQSQQGTRLKDLLTSLPNLQEASVRCTAPFSGKTNSWPVWKALRERIKVGPDNWRYDFHHFDARYTQACAHAALALTEAVGFRASFAGIRPITKLEVHSSHLGSYQDMLRLQHDTALLGVRHQIRIDGFRNLTCLRLHVPHATLRARFYGEGLRQETLAFLGAATKLKQLDLRYTDDELSPDDESPQLECLFSSETAIWPQIKTLKLATNISGETLLKFLQKHAATLRELHLRDMLIHDVESVLTQLPKVVSLRHVYMECLWDDSPDGEFLSVLSRGTDFDDLYERGVRGYLLQESNIMPRLQWDGARESTVTFLDEADDSTDIDDQNSSERTLLSERSA